MYDVEVFTNNNFKVLSYFYDNKDTNNLIKTTQKEVGDALKLSRVTINTVLKKLKDDGYIIHDSTRVGRYYLTELGIKMVEIFRKAYKE